MRLSLFIAVGCLAAVCAVDSQTHTYPNTKRASNGFSKETVVEGSGNEASKKVTTLHSDTEIHGSGYGSDDEDGDVVEGSGARPDVVEGSGAPPPSIVRPLSTTTTTMATPAVTKGTTTTTHAVLHPIDKIEEVEDDKTMSTIEENPAVVVQEATESSTTVRTISTSETDDSATLSPFHHMLKPGIFAAVVGGTVVGLLTAVLLVMFIIHRMRKKDEGSYALDEPKPRPYAGYAYTKASTKEFYA